MKAIKLLYGKYRVGPLFLELDPCRDQKSEYLNLCCINFRVCCSHVHVQCLTVFTHGQNVAYILYAPLKTQAIVRSTVDVW